MGKKDNRFRNIEASQYSSPSGYDSYFDYQKALVQDKFNSEFDFSTNAFDVEYEYPRASGSFVAMKARVGPVVTPERGVYLGDDYRKLKFKDLDFRPQLGDKFSFASGTWLVYNTENTLSLSSSCLSRRSNHLINWIDKYGKSHSEPSIIDYFKFTSTYSPIATDKYMRYGKTTRFILMQDNDSTQTIKRDNRFVFDSLAWLITNVDRITHAGLLEISVEEDFITATDDLANEIPRSDSTPVYSIKITNKPIQLLRNRTFQLETLVLKESLSVSGEAVTYVTSAPTKATVSTSGLITALTLGTVTISVSLDSNPTISDSVTISIIAAQVMQDFISGENSVRMSGTYSYEVVNSTGSYVFSLSTSSLAEIISSTSQTVVIKMKNHIGTFNLIAQSSSGPSHVVTLPITIESVW
jgi:hypothetical protein